MRSISFVTFASWLVFCIGISNAETTRTSQQVVGEILGAEDSQLEIQRLRTGLTTLLADQRLADQTVRQMLVESLAVLTEMREQKTGENAPKLVKLAEWLQSQGTEKLAYQGTGLIPTPAQQFVLDNSLAGQVADLTLILQGVLRTYLTIDGEDAGPAKLEALLQLYLNFHPVLERGWWLADDLLFYAPQWMQSRYPRLTADQKATFLKDVNDARAEKAEGLGADEDASPPPPEGQQAAYEAAYRFIVNNTPSS